MSVGAAIWSALGAPWRAARSLKDPEARKGAALLFLGGGGVAMTAFASAALWLSRNERHSALYLGLSAHLLLGIILTGYAGLLVRRQMRVRGPLGIAIESNDEMQAAIVAGAAAGAVAAATPPVPEPPGWDGHRDGPPHGDDFRGGRR